MYISIATNTVHFINAHFYSKEVINTLLLILLLCDQSWLKSVFITYLKITVQINILSP